MPDLIRRRILLAAVAACVNGAALAQTASTRIGVVLMHGKGGSPGRLVSGLASALAAQGFLVANQEMPWSGKREYDVGVAAAEQEVAAAVSRLREQGAQKVYVAGHSQGGVFALHIGGKLAVDGVIAIAPGGDVSNQLFRDKLGDKVEQARKLVAEGKGEEKTGFSDYEGAKGFMPVTTTPAIYLGWFDPAGAMNLSRAIKEINPAVPVLFIAPTQDYPALRRAKDGLFGLLPRHPATRMAEPDATHVGAPAASIEEIVRWLTQTADIRT